MDGLTRKKAAELLGIGVEALRFYEKQGLIGEPKRDASGYRVYSDGDLKAIEHILRIKEYGFTLAEIKDFLSRGEAGQEEIKAAIARKIAEKDGLMAEARKVKERLEDYLKGL